MLNSLPAIRVGKVTAIDADDEERLHALADQMASRGYSVRQTPHFVVCQRSDRAPDLVLIHTFDTTSIDEDLPDMIGVELGGIGAVRTENEYSDALFAIMASSFQRANANDDAELSSLAIWRRYSLNTLVRLRPLLTEDHPQSKRTASHVAQFAIIYRRVLKLGIGTTFLDVGTSLGFLPILTAELVNALAITACDSRPEVLNCAADLAATTKNDRIHFLVRDVLQPDFQQLGQFDTVSAVHLIEHFTDEQLPTALTNLLEVTAHRLIIAVPYEPEMQALYGHKQLFNEMRLRSLGEWCVEHLNGGRFLYEEVSGGLLMIERAARTRIPRWRTHTDAALRPNESA